MLAACVVVWLAKGAAAFASRSRRGRDERVAAPLPALQMAFAVAVVVGPASCAASPASASRRSRWPGSLVVSPAAVVPAIFVLEVLASLRLIGSTWREVDAPRLGWLVFGNVLAIPSASRCSPGLAGNPLRLLIGALLLLAALLLRSGLPAGLRRRAARFATRLAIGLRQRRAAIGGIRGPCCSATPRRSRRPRCAPR